MPGKTTVVGRKSVVVDHRYMYEQFVTIVFEPRRLVLLRIFARAIIQSKVAELIP